MRGQKTYLKNMWKVKMIELKLESWEVELVVKTLERKIEKLYDKPKLDEMRLQEIKEYQVALEHIRQQMS